MSKPVDARVRELTEALEAERRMRAIAERKLEEEKRRTKHAENRAASLKKLVKEEQDAQVTRMEASRAFGDLDAGAVPPPLSTSFDVVRAVDDRKEGIGWLLSVFSRCLH